MPRKSISQKRAITTGIKEPTLVRAVNQIYQDINELIVAVNNRELDTEEDSEKDGKSGDLRLSRKPTTNSSKYVIEGRTEEGWVTTTPLEYVNAIDVTPTPGGKVTISGGAITATSDYHQVATEGGTSSDNLTTINGGAIGQTLTLTAINDTDSVLVDDNAGNIQSAGNFTMNSKRDTISLIYDGTYWIELSRSNNSA